MKTHISEAQQIHVWESVQWMMGESLWLRKAVKRICEGFSNAIKNSWVHMGVIQMAEVIRLQAHWTVPVNKPRQSATHKEKKCVYLEAGSFASFTKKLQGGVQAFWKGCVKHSSWSTRYHSAEEQRREKKSKFVKRYFNDECKEHLKGWLISCPSGYLENCDCVLSLRNTMKKRRF